jgi:predicted AAA+ superfamily ATPase
MNLFDHIDRKALELASGMMRDVLDDRAIDFLVKRPDILNALVGIRQLGKFMLAPREVKQLVVLGVMQVDEQGYFLSEVVEDLIDVILREAEKMKKEEDDAPESRPN